MKKQNNTGRSKARDSSLEVEPVQTIESDVITAEISESQPMEIGQDNTLISEQEDTQSAPEMSRIQSTGSGPCWFFQTAPFRKALRGFSTCWLGILNIPAHFHGGCGKLVTEK